MEQPMATIWLVIAVILIALFVFAFTRRPREPGPPPRKSRTLIERFWDTPEHSDAWNESSAEAERNGRRAPTERNAEAGERHPRSDA